MFGRCELNKNLEFLVVNMRMTIFPPSGICNYRSSILKKTVFKNTSLQNNSIPLISL